MTIAYLVSEYPAPSHTFIRREVAALRALGCDVATHSIRPGRALSGEDRAEAERTFAVLPDRSAGPGALAALAGPLAAGLVRRPRRWAAALRAALRHTPPSPLRWPRAFAYLGEGLRLAAELERRGATHLHSHFANGAAAAGLAAARYAGIGWSVTLHGLSDFGGPTAPLLGATLEDAAFVASATGWGRARLVALAPALAHKVHVVRCGVEPARLPSPARRAPAAGEPLLVLSVGRLAPEKGHAGLVEAFASLVRGGVNAQLAIIGGGPEEPRLRAAVAAAGLRSRVLLCGALPEAAALEAMARAHLFALSSLMEGLPVVLMEALALELPVVAPALTGIPELVADGETGLLYPPGDWGALAAALRRLALDPPLRARLGATGRDRVLAGFDAGRAAEPLARLFAHHARAAAPAADPARPAPRLATEGP